MIVCRKPFHGLSKVTAAQLLADKTTTAYQGVTAGTPAAPPSDAKPPSPPSSPNSFQSIIDANSNVRSVVVFPAGYTADGAALRTPKDVYAHLDADLARCADDDERAAVVQAWAAESEAMRRKKTAEATRDTTGAPTAGGPEGGVSGGVAALPPRSRSKGELFDPYCDETRGLSDEQMDALDAVAHRLNIFLTGRAGSGKTRTLEAMIAAMTAAGTNFATTAASGIAAEALGGQTLHSFLCINDDLSIQTCLKNAQKRRAAEIQALEVLVIDEVSMVSAEIMEKAVFILRALRGRLPVFVLAGDFCQLPPVNGTLLLNTAIWHELSPRVVMLQSSFRQQAQPKFLRLLDEARVGALSDASIQILQARVGVDVTGCCPGVKPTLLTARRRAADEINQEHLAELGGRRFKYTGRLFCATFEEPPVGVGWRVVDDCSSSPPMVHSFAAGPGSRKKVRMQVPPHCAELDICLPCCEKSWMEALKMVEGSLTAPVIELASGAQVMFTANVDPPRIVNGSRGVVTDFSPSGMPVVTLLSGEAVTVEKFCRSKRVARSCPGPHYVYEQVPLQLAYAFTIHKSQGMSIDCARIDLGRDLFSVGQGYVALSRMRTLTGLSISEFSVRSIRADDAVVAWVKREEAKACSAAATTSTNSVV